MMVRCRIILYYIILHYVILYYIILYRLYLNIFDYIYMVMA